MLILSRNDTEKGNVGLPTATSTQLNNTPSSTIGALVAGDLSNLPKLPCKLSDKSLSGSSESLFSKLVLPANFWAEPVNRRAYLQFLSKHLQAKYTTESHQALTNATFKDFQTTGGSCLPRNAHNTPI